MTEPTVTMTLEQYKALESAESTLRQLLADQNKFIHVTDGLYCQYYAPVSEKQMADDLNARIEETNKTAEHWRVKAVAADKKKGIFS